MSEQTPADARPSGATNYTPPTYEISAEDQHHADAILAMDPASLPSRHTADAGIPMPKEVGLAALPPALREQAEAKLAGLSGDSRAQAEVEAVGEVLREHALELRSKGGFAASVPNYWAEKADIAREYNSALAEFDRITAQVSKIARWENSTGSDGANVPKPVYVLGPAAQRDAANRQRELLYRMDLLFKDGELGPEAKRRLDRAMVESIAQAKAHEDELAIREEAKALAAETLRNERISAQAESIAKHHRSTGL